MLNIPREGRYDTLHLGFDGEKGRKNTPVINVTTEMCGTGKRFPQNVAASRVNLDGSRPCPLPLSGTSPASQPSEHGAVPPSACVPVIVPHGVMSFAHGCSYIKDPQMTHRDQWVRGSTSNID